MPAPSAFRIKRNDNIGYPAAEEDRLFLQNCFVDSGDLAILRDTHAPKRILVGRTGAGKTALLIRLADSERHVIGIDPASLSLAYLSNNVLLRFFESLGVNFDLFYKLLWRHVFAVELIKARYNITSPESAHQTLVERFAALFGSGEDKKQAFKYLTDWGESIWKDTEHRVKEITTTLETNLAANLTGSIPIATLAAGGSCTLTQEQKEEIIKRGQEVVDHIQVQHLNRIITLLADKVFADPQNRYYLVIDKLDEDWVEDSLRYKLLRALIETVREFQSIQNCKIIVALRQDLIERVFRFAGDRGFQREKYQQLCLTLQWTVPQLVQILDKRVTQLVCHQYSGQSVSHTDLLPPQADKIAITDYITERTLYRPRDIIHFFNCCLEQASGEATVTSEQLKNAEVLYSRQRLQYLADEWHSNLPFLFQFAVAFLRRRPRSFRLSDIDAKCVEDTCLELATKFGNGNDPLASGAWSVAMGYCEPSDFLNTLILNFYKVGLIGLKLAPTDPVSWSFRTQLADVHIATSADTLISMCPAFYRALETRLLQ